MLRPLLHYSSLFLFKPTQKHSLQFVTSLSSPAQLPTKTLSLPRGKISDVLQILGPIHLTLPTAEVRLYISLLKKCIRSSDSFKGSVVHAHVLKSGFGSDLLVCNVLLDMYAKGGSFGRCRKLFDEMPERDVFSWCTLISGFSNYGHYVESFELFRLMCCCGSKLNCFVISSVLKACAGLRILELVQILHGFVVKLGLGFDPFVEIGFVDCYAKCGNLSKARKLFDEIPIKSPVSCNAMISGYIQQGYFLEGIELFRELNRVGLLMDVVTLRIVASAVFSLGLLEFGKNIHVYSIKLRLSRDNFVVSELVKLLATSGEIEHMRKLFRLVKKPDPSLYTLVISGFNSNGYREEAISLLKELLCLNPDLKEGDFVVLVNTCSVKEEGMQIHSLALKTGHFSYLSVGNALISMYVKLGEMEDAFQTFKKVLTQDVVSWTALMTGYVQCFDFRTALQVFRNLKRTQVSLDKYCVSNALNACTGLKDLNKGKELHSLVLKVGLLSSDFVISSFINMYAKCGQIADFTQLYSQSELNRSLVLINVVLSGFCLNFCPESALKLFLKEHQLGFVPDQFTYSTILSACRDIKDKEAGDQVHSLILKSGFANSDIVVGNSLIDLYLKFGCLSSACKSFYNMKEKNANSYAMLMLGYIQNGNNMEALALFSQMLESGLHANSVIFTRILQGCADMSAVNLGKQVHASIIKIGLVSDVYIEEALVGLYTKSNLLQTEEGERDFGSIGVFTLEGEEEGACENYKNALEFDQNYLMVDLSNCEDNEEKFLKFRISDQVFLVANLGVLSRVRNTSYGLSAT
ncbi:Pentatricopeptide repeat-containing protein [Rhynchospora pubera]|uniref:Pentatricopeptide repeat-containing protein n=1 Tax=Rhynchospora pubera TaxID=906938 RepID=A0AAV8GSP7_9POAL|nr:Pentatricopeptide repeat-containing protein [Rhynchospora pubera]